MQLGKGHVHLRRVDVGATAALEVGFLRRPADDGHVLRVAQGQQAVVLQQHHRLGRDAPRQGMMGGHVEFTLLGRFGRAADDGQDAAGGFVHHRLIQFAVAHRLDDGIDARLLGAGHFQVQPGLQRRHPVVHRAPVGDDKALKTPLVLQDVGQQAVVFGGVGSVDLVVGAHHRPGLGLGHGLLERGQVDLAQGALIHLGVD